MRSLNGASKSSVKSANQLSMPVGLSADGAKRVTDNDATRVSALSWCWKKWGALKRMFGFCDHNIHTITSHKLYYQKGDQPKRMWFYGTYNYCMKHGCEWSSFHGDPKPWATDRAPNLMSKEIFNASQS